MCRTTRAPNAAVQLAGIQVVRRGHLGNGQPGLRWHADCVERPAHDGHGEGVPVELATHGEAQLLDLIEADVLPG